MQSISKISVGVRGRVLRCLLLSALGCLPNGYSEAQQVEGNGTASVRGVVTDPSGALVVEASVVLAGPRGQPTWTTPVDSQGRYGFANLAAGAYIVRVTAAGFAVFESKAVQLTADRSRELDVRLEIATQHQVANVSSEESGEDADPNRNSNAVVLKGRDLDNLPLDSSELLQELKGLAGSDSPEIYVDGFSGGTLPPTGSIREIRINQNPYSARNDTNPVDGMIEIFTKPGTDRLHAEAYLQGNGSGLNTQNPFLTGQPAYYSLLWAGELSGAINKKSSFFVSESGRSSHTNALVNAAILSGGQQVNFVQALPSPLTAMNVAPRVDLRAGAKSTISFLYSLTRTRQTNGGVGQFALAAQGYDSLTTSQTLQAANSQVFNAKIVNDTRFRYVRTRLSQMPYSFDPSLVVQGAFTDGGNNMGTIRDNQDRYEAQNYISIQAGRHFLSPGARVRAWRDANYSTANYKGQLTFSTLNAYQITLTGHAMGWSAAQIRAAGGGASQYTLTSGNPNVAATVADAAVFFQDDWKALPHFTLSYGLRFETQNHISDRADWAPRLGFTWGVGAKKDKPAQFTLRGGTGLFYQRLALANVLLAERQDGVRQQQYQLAQPDCYPNESCSAGTNAQLQPTIYQISPAYRAPYALNSSVGVDRGIGKSGTVSVTYTYNRGVHVLVTRNANAPLPGTYDPANPMSGVRPLGGTQNIYQYDSTGVWRQSRLAANFFLRVGPKFNLYGNYRLRFDKTDANGGGFASNQYNLAADYGRSPGDVRHALTLGTNVPLPWGIHLYSYVQAQSGSPFNIVLGQDQNGDSIFNDRPAYATDLTRPSVVKTAWGTFDTSPIAGQRMIPVNLGQGPALFTVNGGLGRSLAFGPELKVVSKVVPAGGAVRPAAKPDRMFHLEFGLSVVNLFNEVNLAPPVGTLNSPLFGRSTALAAASGSTSANREISFYTYFRF